MMKMRARARSDRASVPRALTELVLRGCQVAYPAEFRRTWGAELAGVTYDRCIAEAREAGILAAAWYAARTILDIVRTGLRSRWTARQRRASSPKLNSAPGNGRSPGKASAMDKLLQDFRFAVRVLASRPLFTATALLSLALGIGANTAVFSLVNAAMLRSLPVDDPDSLVVVLEQRGEGRINHNFAYPDFVDYRDRVAALGDLAAYSFVQVSIGSEGDGERAAGLHVSGNYFDLLGVEAHVGRTFLPEEYATRGTHPVVVLSHGSWTRRFGADPAIVGRDVRLNNSPFTVIGVAAAGFTGTYPGRSSDVFIPVAMYNETVSSRRASFGMLDSRAASWLFLVGRLAPGFALQQAQEELRGVAAALAEEFPDSNGQRTDLVLVPGARGHYGSLQSLATPLVTLMAVVALLLFIACANVANLMLARATDRNREIGVRVALGASRGRLVRQLLSESVVLSLVGGLLGIGIARASADILFAYLDSMTFGSLQLDAGLDATVMAFTATLTAATGILFGLVPALRASRHDVVTSLKDNSSGLQLNRGSGTRLQQGLVVVQVALSFGLLVGAGLLVRSVVELYTEEPGFNPDGALVASVNGTLSGRPDPDVLPLFAEIRARVAALPGVTAASFARAVPVDRAGSRGSVYFPERGDDDMPTIDANAVDLDFFAALGVPLIAGRGFTEADVEGAPSVVVVNEALADSFWPGENPIGKQLGLSGTDNLSEVVGVAANGKYRSFWEEQQPYIWTPMRQAFRPDMYLLVRTSVDPVGLFGGVRSAIAEVAGDVPVSDMRTLRDKVSENYYTTRVTAWLMAAFGGIGGVLATLGLYGVLAYSVSRRRREIGIRVALGAEAGRVVRLVLIQGLGLVIAGMVFGGLLAIATTRFFESLLYGVEPTDVATLVTTAVLLLVVGVLACLLPAVRASRVDPMLALRRE